MSKPPDLEALARRYLDLWQDQATALAGDAELTRQVGRWLSTMQAGIAHAFQPPSSPPGAKTGASSSAPSPGGGNLRLDEFARRLAALEKRLDRLEGRAEGGGKPTRRRTRRGKT